MIACFQLSLALRKTNTQCMIAKCALFSAYLTIVIHYHKDHTQQLILNFSLLIFSVILGNAKMEAFAWRTTHIMPNHK